MNNKLPNCTVAPTGSSTQRLKEEGSMVTGSFSSHLCVYTYIIQLLSAHTHYTGTVYIQAT